MWSWLRGLSDIATLIQLAGSAGGATVLAVLIPAVLQTVFDLPVALIVVLGIGVFFVALAVILSLLKAVLERGSSAGGRNLASNAVSGPPGTSTQDVQETSQHFPQRAASVAYPWAETAELRAPYIHNRSLYIFDLAHKNTTIRGRTFEDCQVYGPAIVAPYYGEWPFDEACTWEEAVDPINLLWASIPNLDRQYIGVIGLDNCTFRNCSFVRVGMLVNPERFKSMTGLPAPEIFLDESEETAGKDPTGS